MAGDWIKMRADLFTHPKVVRISSALKVDTLRTVGGLMSVWCLFDAHSIDGRLDGYSQETLDAHLRWDGFAAAMIAVDWLSDNGESLVLPEFDTHNGASAKRRAQDANRKRDFRKTSANEADKKRTREEKRREEVKATTTPAASVDPIAEMIAGAVEFMGGRGVPEKQARSVVGMIRKTVGDDLVVAELLAAAARDGVAEPVSWLRQAANKRKQAATVSAGNPWDGAL